MDEKELTQRDAHIRSFAIAQVLHVPGHSCYAGSAAGVQIFFSIPLAKTVQTQASLAVNVVY